ncbi:hypothetical protein LCGC14_1125580 [marine sediment metagenome]|uniref:Uncharacterized protein n=1 Tax=marine sediment metagenome TaxID=412755 RepID=A0A0F9M2Q3_9ZZZZ
MKTILLTIVCSLILMVGGCSETLTGIGIGVAATETAKTWEGNIGAKRVELDLLYDTAILQMENATSMEEVEAAKKRVEEITVAKIVNEAVTTVVAPADERPKTTQEWMTYGMGLLLAFGGNEMRKRTGYQKAISRLEAKATPEEAAKIHETVKASTRILG